MGRCCTNCTDFLVNEWSSLDPENHHDLNKATRHQRYLPGEPVYHEGDAADALFCLHDGLVGIRKLGPEGESVLLRLVQPGQTFGFRALLTGTEHRAGAEALKPSLICSLQAGTARRMIDDSPLVARRFLEHMATDLAETEAKVLESAAAPARVRFMRLMLAVGERRSSLGEGREVCLDLPISRQDLAALLGIRPESMSRIIKALQKEGIAHFTGRRVRIPFMDRVAEEIGQEAAV